MEYGISGYQSHYRFRKKSVIELDSQLAHLTGNTVSDKVYLLATKEDDNLIYTDLTLVIENGTTGERQFYQIPTSSGMGGGLDIAEFNHDGQCDVGVYIFSGGTGNQVDYYIFFNQGQGVQLGFSNHLLEQRLQFRISYLPNYQVEVRNLKTNEVTLLDVSNKSPEYLNEVYHENGELKNSVTGVVANVSDSNAINSQIHPQGHDLILTQRILGRSHNDTIGLIQSYISFDNEKYYVYQSVVSQK